MALLPEDPEKQKQLIIALVPVLALFGYWYFYHGGQRDEVDRMESRLENLEQKNAQAKKIAERAGPELEERLALYEEHIARLERLIPGSEEVSDLLHTMTLRSQDAGVDLAFIRPEASEAGPYYTRKTYEIRVLGAYHDIGRFLATVGSLRRIITPINLKLSPRSTEQDEDDTRELTASFRIETYVIPAPTEEGDNAQA